MLNTVGEVQCYPVASTKPQNIWNDSSQKPCSGNWQLPVFRTFTSVYGLASTRLVNTYIHTYIYIHTFYLLTRNVLDCNQSNYSSRIIFTTG